MCVCEWAQRGGRLGRVDPVLTASPRCRRNELYRRLGSLRNAAGAAHDSALAGNTHCDLGVMDEHCGDGGGDSVCVLRAPALPPSRVAVSADAGAPPALVARAGAGAGGDGGTHSRISDAASATGGGRVSGRAAAGVTLFQLSACAASSSGMGAAPVKGRLRGAAGASAGPDAYAGGSGGAGGGGGGGEDEDGRPDWLLPAFSQGAFQTHALGCVGGDGGMDTRIGGEGGRGAPRGAAPAAGAVDEFDDVLRLMAQPEQELQPAAATAAATASCEPRERAADRKRAYAGADVPSEAAVDAFGRTVPRAMLKACPEWRDRARAIIGAPRAALEEARGDLLAEMAGIRAEMRAQLEAGVVGAAGGAIAALDVRRFWERQIIARMGSAGGEGSVRAPVGGPTEPAAPRARVAAGDLAVEESPALRKRPRLCIGAPAPVVLFGGGGGGGDDGGINNRMGGGGGGDELAAPTEENGLVGVGVKTPQFGLLTSPDLCERMLSYGLRAGDRARNVTKLQDLNRALRSCGATDSSEAAFGASDATARVLDYMRTSRWQAKIQLLEPVSLPELLSDLSRAGIATTKAALVAVMREQGVKVMGVAGPVGTSFQMTQ